MISIKFAICVFFGRISDQVSNSVLIFASKSTQEDLFRTDTKPLFFDELSSYFTPHSWPTIFTTSAVQGMRQAFLKTSHSVTKRNRFPGLLQQICRIDLVCCHRNTVQWMVVFGTFLRLIMIVKIVEPLVMRGLNGRRVFGFVQTRKITALVAFVFSVISIFLTPNLAVRGANRVGIAIQ